MEMEVEAEVEVEPSESDCDWHPPIEIPIVESHVLQIPSRLIPFDDFLKLELGEEHRDKLEDEKIEEMEDELGEEEEQIIAGEASLTESSIIIEEATDAIVVEQISLDDFEAFKLELTEPKVKEKTKRITIADSNLTDVVSKFQALKLKVQQEAEEALRIQINEITDKILNTLIEKVVNICEYVDPDDFLRAQLDKEKVFSDVIDKMSKLDDEYAIQVFLDLTAARYFWRKKKLQPLQNDKYDELDNYMRKYHDRLMVVNQHMAVLEPTKAMILQEKGELQSVVDELKMQSESKINEFVDSVKLCFGADSSEKLNTLIDIFTRKMNNLRKEISHHRFILIQRQHTLADLQERSRKLEDLGEGLRMHDFEILLTEVDALPKKTEERTRDLNRFRHRCIADIHLCAHIREKQKMTRSTISSLEEYLEELIEEKQATREHLNDLRQERFKIRMELKQYNLDIGLGAKPELLHDYDYTVDRIQYLREKVASMKDEYMGVYMEIQEMVKKLRT